MKTKQVNELEVYIDDAGFACVDYFDVPTYLSIMQNHVYYSHTTYEILVNSATFTIDKFGNIKGPAYICHHLDKYAHVPRKVTLVEYE